MIKLAEQIEALRLAYVDALGTPDEHAARLALIRAVEKARRK